MARQILIATALALLLGALPVHACSCIRGEEIPTREELTAPELVLFAGEALEVRAKPSGDAEADKYFVRGTVTTFRVERSWDDVLPPEVSVESGFPGAGCGILFEAGKRYLVFARQHGATLDTSICTRTTLVEKAPGLLERVVAILGAGSAPLKLGYAGECPDPKVESMLWREVGGTVRDVIDARTLTFRTTDSRTVSVTIANLAAKSAPEAADALRRMVLGREVSVLVNPSAPEEDEVVGEVLAGSLNVGRELLRTGMAAFEPAAPHTVSASSECLNRLASREAQKERLGMWGQ